MLRTDQAELRTLRMDHPPHVRVAIIGSGFAGLAMAIELKRRGLDDFVILERADDIGGAWRDNTYPGCACDVPSTLYSFSFAANPDWTSSFSPQQEIHQYLRACVHRFGLGSPCGCATKCGRRAGTPPAKPG
jgi:cation diffusion facilitator CzcD-associated flavoprotein CzcO